MMRGTTDPVTHDDFWRCAACGTPNPARAYLTRCLGCGGPVSKAEVIDPPIRGRGSRRGRWIAIVSWIYAAFILVVLALVSWVGNAWWGVTVLLFVPRWLFLGPVVALALASAWKRKPSQWVLQGTMALVIAGPLMGFTLSPERIWNRKPEGMTVRILTYNVGPKLGNVEGLIRLVEQERVDLLCFQENVIVNPRLRSFLSQGWHRDRTGYIASRYPIVADYEPMKDTTTTNDRYGARLSHVRVRTPQGLEFDVASVHMPTIRPGLYRFLDGDPAGLVMHVAWWQAELGRVVSQLTKSTSTPVLVGGDFNMPSDDSSMMALRSVFRFAFEQAGLGYGYTRPSHIPWFRIDHLMASPHWSFTRCWVGGDYGSDHLPLLAEAVIQPQPRPQAQPPKPPRSRPPIAVEK